MKTLLRATVRKDPADGKWLAECPCGFVWHTTWHRIAVLMITTHRHDNWRRK